MGRFFGHNVLMIGPPGSVKTLRVRTLPGILPEVSIDESLDETRIYSVADALPPDTPSQLFISTSVRKPKSNIE
jgi:predicted ATPase with chaperone activity